MEIGKQTQLVVKDATSKLTILVIPHGCKARVTQGEIPWLCILLIQIVARVFCIKDFSHARISGRHFFCPALFQGQSVLIVWIFSPGSSWENLQSSPPVLYSNQGEENEVLQSMGVMEVNVLWCNHKLRFKCCVYHYPHNCRSEVVSLQFFSI